MRFGWGTRHPRFRGPHGHHFHGAPAPYCEIPQRARLQRRLFRWFGATILLTGLVVGSRSRPIARTEAPPSKTAAPVTAAPSPVAPPVVAAPAPSPTAVAAAPAETPAPSKPEKAEVAAPEVVEKPKPKVTKVVTWKPPKPIAAAESGELEKPAPNPERDDPERAVPERVEDSSNAQPATWQANPGF